MKILVFSDSHGCTLPMKNAVAAHYPNIAAVVHLGDGTTDAEYVRLDYPDIPFCCVAGNAEEFSAPLSGRKTLCLETMLDFGGVKFFLTHGHRFGVKFSPDRLAEYAHKKGADVVLYGHTHQADDSVYELADGEKIRMFNPGSIGPSYDRSYGVIEVVSGIIVTGHGKQ